MPAQTLGLTLHALRATVEREIEDAFAALPNLGASALVIESAPLFTTRMEQLAALTLRHQMPAIYQFRKFPQAGGLVSYGASLLEQYRLAGIYVGRLLKGEKPADLSVQQVTNIELVINLKTAKGHRHRSASCFARPSRRGDRIMRRRDFITLLGGAAAAWPLAARAQQEGRANLEPASARAVL